MKMKMKHFTSFHAVGHGGRFFEDMPVLVAHSWLFYNDSFTSQVMCQKILITCRHTFSINKLREFCASF